MYELWCVHLKSKEKKYKWLVNNQIGKQFNLISKIKANKLACHFKANLKKLMGEKIDASEKKEKTY